MSLKLSVPPLMPSTDVSLRPGQVRKQLSELPLLNVPETGRQLSSLIVVTNRTDLEDDVRLELLELYRRPMRDLASELQKQYLGKTLPLANRQKAAAEQNRQFQMELAAGYKRIVLNDASNPSRPPHEIALAIQRALRHLGEAIAISYKAYSPVPLVAWPEIHTLYRQAETLGVANVPVEDALNRPLLMSSVAHAYKQALLLELADPYHLPSPQIGKIQQYLDRWGDLAALLPANKLFGRSCQFLLDQSSDGAGIVHDENASADHPERQRLLNTVKLAHRAHLHLASLLRGEHPDPDGLDDDFFRDDTQDIFRRLIRLWGRHPTRGFRRNRRTETKLDVAIGIPSVNYWLNGGTRFTVSAATMGPTPYRNALGISAMPPRIAASDQPDPEFLTWDVINESAGGFSLLRQDAHHNGLRIGDLLALRAPGDLRAWNVAAIRWARSVNTSQIEIGVQRLAPAAHAVAIKLLTDDGKQSDFLSALRLPAITLLKQAASLITPRGVFRPQREIYLDDGNWLHRVVATQIVEVSPTFERFQFKILPAA